MTGFQEALVRWFELNKRDLPWRRNADPYPVWVSEVMLQQTTVAAVVPFYERWMERCPCVEDLANAQIDDVLAYWQGLGYYRRARMLHEGAKTVVAQGWPVSVKEWRALPGIGAYTAAAVGSIAQGLAAAVVDGNVERVYARLTCDGATGTALKGRAQAWADDVLVADDPGLWNQAVMDLGAIVCTPAQPKCGSCPVAEWCRAKSSDQVASFPSAKPKKEWVELAAKVWVPVNSGKVGIRRVPQGRWWEGMWEFPREEDTATLDRMFPGGLSTPIGSVKHVVTRHRITVEVSQVDLEAPVAALKWVDPAEVGAYAMPSVYRKILAMARI